MFAGCEKLIVRASWSEEPAVETQYWWRFTKYAHLVISYLLSCFLSGGRLLLCVHTGIDPGRQRKMRRKQKATRKNFSSRFVWPNAAHDKKLSRKSRLLTKTMIFFSPILHGNRVPNSFDQQIRQKKIGIIARKKKYIHDAKVKKRKRLLFILRWHEPIAREAFVIYVHSLWVRHSPKKHYVKVIKVM